MKISSFILLFAGLLLIAGCSKETIMQEVSSTTSTAAEALTTEFETVDEYFVRTAQEQQRPEVREIEDMLRREAAVLNALVDGQLLPVQVGFVPGDFPTIQAAVNVAGDDDIIIVSGGPYDEDVNISGFDNLRILADGPVEINGHITIENSTNVLVRGFTLNSTVNDADETLIDVADNNGPGIRIIGNTLDFPVSTMNEKIGIYAGSNLVIVKGNVIQANQSSERHTGIELPGDAGFIKGNSIEFGSLSSNFDLVIGIYLRGGENIVFRNEILGAEDGIQVFDGNNNVIDNNTSSNNDRYGIVFVFAEGNSAINNTALANGLCDIQNDPFFTNTESNNTANCISGF